jgi:hypothetical protein
MLPRAAVETAVTSPFPFTVITGTDEVLPKVPVFEFTVASVVAKVILAEPLKEAVVPVKSPDHVTVRAVLHLLAEFVLIAYVLASAAQLVPSNFSQNPLVEFHLMVFVGTLAVPSERAGSSPFAMSAQSSLTELANSV